MASRLLPEQGSKPGSCIDKQTLYYRATRQAPVLISFHCLPRVTSQIAWRLSFFLKGIPFTFPRRHSLNIPDFMQRGKSWPFFNFFSYSQVMALLIVYLACHLPPWRILPFLSTVIPWFFGTLLLMTVCEGTTASNPTIQLLILNVKCTSTPVSDV